MKAKLVVTTLLFGITVAMASEFSYKPPNGFVPDAATAVKIAEAVLTPIYGKDRVAQQRPFRARLIGETWRIEGTIAKDSVGGVAEVDIAKADARVLRLTHGR
jgi:hypothetical protein